MNNTNNLQLKVKINKIFTDNRNLKAFASVTICESIAIHGIKIIDSQNGLIIRMPFSSYKDKDGKKQYRDIAHPITKESRQLIQDCIIKEYNHAIDNCTCEKDVLMNEE